MSLVEKAITLAFSLHKDQVRKASIVPGSPYMSHLLAVTGMVMANGGTETECAAAVLHDALEDVGGNARRQILKVCGPGVLSLVEECTEIGTGKGGEFKAPWIDRKQAYLAHLQYVSQGALLISVCDKLHSLQEMYRQHMVQGTQTYEAFAKKEYSMLADRKQAVLWFHQQLSTAFVKRLHELAQEGRNDRLLAIEVLVINFSEIVRSLSVL